MATKILLFLSIFSLYGLVSAQNVSLQQPDSLLQASGLKACSLIDTIDTDNFTRIEVNKRIHAIVSVLATDLKIRLQKDTLDSVFPKPEIQTPDTLSGMNSYYYGIQSYLMEHCPEVKKKIAVLDKSSSNSYSTNQEALQLYVDGMEQMRFENYSQALTTFTKAAQIDSSFVFALENAGVCARKLGRYNDAVRFYKRALQTDSTSMFSLQNIALIYYDVKNYQSSLFWYKRLAVLYPDSPEAYYGMAMIQLHTRSFSIGLKNICKAYKLYVASYSLYRVDAESVLLQYQKEMNKTGLDAKFKRTLAEYDILIN